MIVPRLSSGCSRSALAPAMRAEEKGKGDSLSGTWRGNGYVLCRDGKATAIYDLCGENPADGAPLACSRAESICQGHGGTQLCTGVITPGVRCRI